MIYTDVQTVNMQLDASVAEKQVDMQLETFRGPKGYSPKVSLRRLSNGVEIKVVNEDSEDTETVYDGHGSIKSVKVGETSYEPDETGTVDLGNAIGLPPVTETDNGKVLGVVNGAWAAKTPEESGVDFETDDTLTLEDNVLSVNTTDVMEENNTLPITSAAVYAVVGDINTLLAEI